MPTKVMPYYITKTTINTQKVSIVCMYSKRHVPNQNLLNLEILNRPLHAASLDHGRLFFFANGAWSIRKRMWFASVGAWAPSVQRVR